MKHLDAVGHVRGESQYVDDLPLPAEMLYAAVFASPVAHGKIRSLDIEDAVATEGTFAVLTASDIPGENQIGPVIQDETLLAAAEVHYLGQPIALTIAKSPEIARQAARKVKLQVEELPLITHPREAFAKGHIIGTPRTFVIGDVDVTWDQCEVVVEGTCESPGQEHLYLETQRARAVPLEGGKVLIYSSTQAPYAVQRIAARVLGVAHNMIEVDVKRLGGAFGGKEDQANAWACMAALAAMHTGKPVEIVLSRIEDIAMTGKRHPYSSDFKIGAAADGKILAYSVKFYQNSGAAADLSPPILERTLFHGVNAYHIPNARLFAACCRTNLVPNTAFRGFGAPQAMFAIECAITKLAEKMEKPREEIQQLNLIAEGEMFPYGQRATRARSRLSWERATKLAAPPDLCARIAEYNAAHFASKKGFALMPICFGISFTTTFLNQASCLMHVYTDGSVSVTTGGIEMGQGLSTNIASIAVKTLGIAEQRVRVESTNTTRIANMSPTAASSGTHMNGNATLLAANQIVDRLKEFAAKELGLASPDSIAIVDEKVLYQGYETGWSWSDLVGKAYLARVPLSAHAFFATPDIWFDKDKEKGEPFAYHVYGTSVVEVTVDCLRGCYQIDSVKIAHDLGRPLNKTVDLGQIEGGLAQGLGWMTIEDLQFDSKGRCTSSTLATYKAPDIYFMPDDLTIELIEEPEFKGPYGAKAVGEPPFMYGIAVFFAIRRAMKAFQPYKKFGFRAPMTPERVLLELHSEHVQETARQIYTPAIREKIKLVSRQKS